MSKLTTQLKDNYQEHPSFVFNTNSWQLSDELLTTFNEAYATAHKIGATLDNESLLGLKQDCQYALNTIFTSLQTQCSDTHETYFLKELHSECNRLLSEELAWHSKHPTSTFAQLENTEKRKNAMALQKDRHFFGHLSPKAVLELRRLVTPELEKFRANATAGRLTREALSINNGPTVRSILKVLNREFKSSGVLDAVSTYTGRKTRVIGLALELSVQQASWWKNAISGLERPPSTLYAHLDETISCPKSIIYLSDVTEENGPTGCYPGLYEAIDINPLQEMIGRVVGSVGSADSSPLKKYYAKQYHQSVNSVNFRRHFMRLPESIRFNSHLGWDVMPNSELETEMTNREHKMIGSAGTFIIFDGARLFHRGGLIQQGERVALQVIFSDLTMTQRIINKIKRMLS